MKSYRSIHGLLTGLLLLAGRPGAEMRAAGIDIYREGAVAAIGVSISGFSPDVASVLAFDLLFMGFTNVPPDQAKFLITGSNQGRIEGRVTERINKRAVLAKIYTSASIRAQTHAFADEIAETITGAPGIAQTRIAFKAETGRSQSEIYLADYDGANARPVTRDGALVTSPTWAGKGMLLYSSYKLGAPYIFSHDLGSGARSRVAAYPGSNFSPAASPDGGRVAMILSKSGSPDLYVANRDGSSLKRLTATRAEESSPCWSPDGRTICYVSKSSGVNALYTISVDGGEPRRIQTAGVLNPTEPDWSPDGKSIIFTSLMKDFNICVVPATGGRATVLTGGEDPTWARNSRAVIFCRGPDHRKHLSLLDVPTKQVKDIARILESNSQPSWAK